jgi:hypothetical protein
MLEEKQVFPRLSSVKKHNLYGWKAQLWNKECEPIGWNLDDNAQRRADCRIGLNEFNNV